MQIHAAAAVHSRDQHMLFIWHACILVVDHFTVAIKREAVFCVATDAKNGNSLIGGHFVGDLSASGRAE